MSFYTTTARVRAESGFEMNPDINNTKIQGYLTQAHSVLLGYVSGAYDTTKFSGSLFTGSQAESMLQRIEELFASGYLLVAEYGSQARDTDKDGYARIKEAEKLCTSIIDGTIGLYDVNGSEFNRKSVATAGSIVMTTPENNTSLEPIFTTSQTF